MNITERQKLILKIVEENTYISVNDLAKITFTSPSSIRRDLEAMQNLGLVKRSHGGVGLPEMTSGVASFYNRATKSVREKRLIAEKASSLLRNGQSILLDSSTTASFLIPYIAELDSPTVFTNNLETAIASIKKGIKTCCIGGFSIGGSVALGGSQAYEALLQINVDVVFFSSQSLSCDGVISDSTEAENFIRREMLRRAKKSVFLCDSTKFNTTSLYTLANLDSVDFAVFDRSFEELSTKAKML